ncbi:MAG: sigma 54-interacting transcriptional regulator [Clostridia bacterium]|nr:sigma 54-interacting transcriptional regulator [Clostridia bacterium]
MKEAFLESDSIVVIDTEGKIMFHNEYTNIYSKYKSENILGKHIFEVYDWLSQNPVNGMTVLRTGEPVLNQLQVINPNTKDAVQCIFNSFPLKNSKGLIGAINVSSIINTSNNDKAVSYNRKNFLTSKYEFNNIITNNIHMKKLIEKLKNASKSDSSIFIYGETGTGKELFAHSIHNFSNRSKFPFISQNCAAIPETLMESIIFGTSKGSFTGAQEKKGIFELANKGTLFLDEINSMPLNLQSKLLRVLEDGKIRRLGDNKEIDVDVRIIASTNESLEKLIQNNSFRTDLYFRLNVVSASILPLRERKDDISLLCNYFIDYFSDTFDQSISKIDNNALVKLIEYSWPGNIRELKNCIESAHVNVTDGIIRLNDLPQHIISNIKSEHKLNIRHKREASLSKMVEQYEKEIIESSLIENFYKITKTANDLGIPRQSLYNKIKKYNIECK